MTTTRAWISAQDVCALALVRDLRGALARRGGRLDGAALEAAAHLPAFQALLRERCLDADARDHVLLDLEPGMLAALRALGFCGAEHEGVPVCIAFPSWKNPFTGVRPVKAPLRDLKATPGFLGRFRRQPLAAQALDEAVRDQLSLLQFGPPKKGRPRRPATFVHAKNAESVRNLLVQILIYVERYVRKKDARALADVMSLLERLRQLFDAEVASWLLQSTDAEAAAFRLAKDKGTRGKPVPFELSAVPKDSPLRKSTELTAALFAARLEEFVAGAVLSAVNGFPNQAKDQFVKDAQSLAPQGTPPHTWRLFWFLDVQRNTYRLAVVETFPGPQQRSVHIEIYSLQKLAAVPEGPLKITPFQYVATLHLPTEQLRVGLNPSGVSPGPKGEDIEDLLTLQTRAMSPLGEDYLHQGFRAIPEREREAALAQLSHRAAPSPEATFGIETLSRAELARTAVCQRADHLSKQDQDRILLEMARHLRPPPRLDRSDFDANFTRLEPDLSSKIDEAVRKARIKLRERGVASVRREVKLEIEAEGQKYAIDLDTPDAANLVRYLLCKNVLPLQCRVANLDVLYYDASGRELVNERESVFQSARPPLPPEMFTNGATSRRGLFED